MQKACNVFYSTKGAILVGTEMAFSCMKEEVTHSAIVSLDGLLSIPSYNINQKILHLIEKLSSVTTRNMIIQTRIPENIVLKHVLLGNVLPLYRSDLKEREDFGYPPYKRLIKITFTGTARENEKARDYLEKIFAQYEPQIFSAFVSRVKGQYVTNTVIKVANKFWPFPPKEKVLENNMEYKDLYEKLSSLPPQFAINVDPEDLL
jgi:primosomal protein N' (replication factor Y)